MSNNLGNLNVSMSLESAQFISGMKRAAAQSQATNKAISSAMGQAKTAITGLIAVMSVDAFVGAAKGAFDYADSIVDLADRTGATVKSIQELRYAAQMTGSDFETADTALEKFAKKLGDAQSGNKSAAASFADLGVKSKDFDSALRETMDGISKLDTKQKQNAATTEMFGKKAGTLTMLMSEGSRAFDEFARKAEDLGIVMGDDLLRNAGEVNDKLDTMKMIVNAQFANAIVQNAGAIVSLADGITKLVSSMIAFWGQNPRLMMTLMGAGVGALVGNLPGAIAGGAIGFAAGDSMGNSMDDNNNNLAFRRQKLRAAKARYDGLKGDTSDGTESASQKDAKDALMRQVAFANRAARAVLNAKKGVPKTEGGTLPKIGGGGSSHKSSGKSSADLAREEAEKLADYLRDMDRSNVDLLNAKQALTSNIVEQSAFEREMLTIESKNRKASIDADGPNGAKRYTAAQAEALKAMEDKVFLEKADLINLRENEELNKQANDIRNAVLGNERDLLSSSANLARTAGERRAISLRLLDLQYQQETLALDAILASKQSTDAEKQIAQARLSALDGIKANDRRGIERDTMGPMASYLDTIPRTADEINEALEKATVDGLQGFSTGIWDAVRGAGSLGDAFGDLANTVINGLAQIAIQQALIQPLGSLLFGGGSGGGGIFSSLLSSVVGGLTGGVSGGSSVVMGGAFNNFIGARANGGLTRQGRYLVGERGPEIVDIGNTASVIPNHALNAVAGGRSGPTFNFGGIVSNDPAAIRMAAMQAVMQAMPMINENASKHTIAKLGRPRL